MGKRPIDRVKTLLGKLDAIRASKFRGSEISNEAMLVHRNAQYGMQSAKSIEQTERTRHFGGYALSVNHQSSIINPKQVCFM